ncbi:hypothetical protein LG943_03180 [Streptomonospora sp. S1-112]|uniref:Uncharacterized protein n=1 Tax=Streptomonospora mangrovi TaxID=2883123 RepID=A0A9X3SC78_9ACTN|nr:hypothetical protein [Streptomonospora mangrovi]MDA0563338.1 hypothetical protein [Streptomonospora mangrovi]
MPQLVTLRWRRPGGRRHTVHIPVLPVLVVLSPLLLLAVLAGLVACRIFGISPGGALRGAGRLLWALPGTQVEFHDGSTAMTVAVN